MEKHWIVYPNSEKIGLLTYQEVLDLVNKEEIEILLIKNKQKNAVFTIDFFKEEFMNQSGINDEDNNQSKNKKS